MSSIAAEIPREKLKILVERDGEGLLRDPDRCEGLLKDHCGSHRKEISALVGALEERVPLELKSSWQTATTPEAMRARLVQRLEDNRGLAPDVAAWAVDAWSYALGVSLARKSDRVEDAAAGGAAAAAAGVAGATGAALAETTHASIAERVASDRASGAALAGGGGALERAGGAVKHLAGSLSTPQKAGIGAVAFLVLAGAGIAALHHPKPIPASLPTSGPSSSTPSSNPGSNPSSNPGSNPGTNPGSNPGTGSNPTQGSGTAQGSGSGRAVANRGQYPGTTNSGTTGAREPVPPVYLAAGTPIEIRLDQAVESNTASVGALLDATVAAPVIADGNVVVPTGAKARVKVTGIDQTGQVGGVQHMRLALVSVTTGTGPVAISTRPRDFTGTAREAAKRAGIGGAVGAVGGFVVGKVFHHGGAGAATGAAGGATVGAVTAQPGPVELAPERVILFRLSEPASIPS